MKAKQIAEVSKHGSKNLLSWGANEGICIFTGLNFRRGSFQKGIEKDQTESNPIEPRLQRRGRRNDEIGNEKRLGSKSEALK